MDPLSPNNNMTVSEFSPSGEYMDEHRECLGFPSSYMVIAGNPRATSFLDESIPIHDLVQWLEAIRQYPNSTILIPDSAHAGNILIERANAEAISLHGKGAGKKTKEARRITREAYMADSANLQIAREQAYYYGLRDICFLEAIQDHLDSKKTPGQRPSIQMMSETIEQDPIFQALLMRLRTLYASSDDRAKQLILSCIPPVHRERISGNPEYTIYELATNLYYHLGGSTKIGPRTEERWDEPTKELITRFGKELGIETDQEFRAIYPDIRGSRDVFYSRVALEDQPQRLNPLSLHQGILNRPAEFDAFLKRMFPEREEDFFALKPSKQRDVFEKTRWGKMMKFEEIFSIYVSFLKRLKNCTKLGEKREEVIENEVMKILKGGVLELANVPTFRFLLLRSGIIELEAGELEYKGCPFDIKSKNTLPFECRKQPGESEAGYKIRFFMELLQGMNGPISMHMGRLASSVGFEFWLFLEDVCAILKGISKPEGFDYYKNHWRYEDFMDEFTDGMKPYSDHNWDEECLRFLEQRKSHEID